MWQVISTSEVKRVKGRLTGPVNFAKRACIILKVPSLGT